MTSRSNVPNVPEGWRMVRLGEAADIVMGQSPLGELVSDWDGTVVHASGLPFIQGNAEFGSKSPNPLKWCTHPQKVGVSGDILISVRAPVGETNKADRNLGIGRGLAAVRFKEPSHAFGWHVLNHARGGLERVGQGSTFQAVGGVELRSLPILLPPLKEQRAIASVLDSIDDAIERTDEVIASTEQLRDSLLHDLLTRGVPGWHSEWKDDPDLGTIPADWAVVRLGEVCTPPQYGAAAAACPFDPTLPRYVRITDITDDGRLRRDEIASAEPSAVEGFDLSSGDLLFARSGATVGKTYLYRAHDGPCVYAGYLIRFRPLGELALPEFLERCTRSQSYRRWVESMFRAGAQPNINATEYSSLLVPLPSLEEQEAVVRMLDSVERILEQVRHEMERLQALKTSTADALLTGRVRVGLGVPT